jgi:hypothetical protein
VKQTVAVLAFACAVCLSSAGSANNGLPPQATLYKKEIVPIPGLPSPITTLFYSVKGEYAGVMVESSTGEQLARATVSPSIELWEGTGAYDLTGDGVPEIVLVAMVGAKTINAVVYQYQDHQLLPIWQWSGWSFRAVQLRDKPVIAATPGQYGTLTDLYQWRSGKFAQCNECFPEFYKDEIEQQYRILQQVGLPATVFARACVLGATALVYGRKYFEAMQLCQTAHNVLGDPTRLIPGNRDSQQSIEVERATEEIDRAIKAVDHAREKRSAKLQLGAD